MTPVLGLCALLLTSGLLATGTSAKLNRTTLVVTVNAEVTGGQQETLCAHVADPTEPLGLSVKLREDVVLREAVRRDFHRCVNFTVPVVRKETVAAVTVALEGETTSVKKETNILIRPPASIHIVQTDKPIYKPGQKVQFRIVSLDTDFIPVDRVYTLVAIQDPQSNRIAQWLDKPVSGILDLSHPLIPEAKQGTYKITATTDKGEQISHSFDVEEYVLPKFEVTLTLPKVLNVLEREAQIKICGKYTYGKPVLGSITLKLLRDFSWYARRPILKMYELTTDTSGCAIQTVNVAEFSKYKRGYKDTISASAELTEFGTGVVLKGSGTTKLSSFSRKAILEDLADAYQTGIPFEGKVKVVDWEGKPLAGESMAISGQNSKANVTTDQNGVASFSLDTTQWKDGVRVAAAFNKLAEHADTDRLEHVGADQWVPQFYSKSRSFLRLMHTEGKVGCGGDATVRVRHIVQGHELADGQEVLDVFYLVVTKGQIVQNGRIPLAVTQGSVHKGETSIVLQEASRLAPFAQVVVYAVMPSGELLADSRDFPVQLCLRNKVSLRFQSPRSLPAERTTLRLQAQPGSLCSLRAVDHSVLLLRPEEELSVKSVYQRLPSQKREGYPTEVEEHHHCTYDIPPVQAPRRAQRSTPFEQNNKRADVYGVFKNIGIKIVTNSEVKNPEDCHPLYGFFFSESEDYDGVAMANTELEPELVSETRDDPPPPGMDAPKKETVRTFFPETWIWDLVPVGDSGSADVEKTVPDTITKWAAGAFCVSPAAGLGVAPVVGLTAFQPFFVSLTLPYSVVRGEVFALRASVFNYLSKCIMVKLTLPESDQYTFRNCEGCYYTMCLCGEESATFSWMVTPTALGGVKLKVSAEALKTDQLCGNEVAVVPDEGQVDTVIRTLLVEAEGTPQMVSHNALLCPADGPVEKKISLVLPEKFVAGSARASVSVLGDLMGRAMKNLDKLLAMPYGCGEQNMVLFAPNIFILDYLKSTGQLTQQIQERATRFLESGYQRELNYKHTDGSYSAFGMSDESGNTWLTSFVMKSFAGARPYIFVDPGHIKQARDWLSRRQKPGGCIASVGKLFHNGMKGGVSDDVSLTAYITAAMLELDANATDPVVQRCLACLKAALAGPMDNLYTRALLSYTFTLAGDQETRSKLVADLHRKANAEGGGRHWVRAGASGKGLDPLEVEMTSYVLLALLSGPELTGFGLDYSSGIVRWLAQQQNPYGGFASTQDTVVALQALAKYGAATYSEEGATAVTVTSVDAASSSSSSGDDALRKEFSVDQSNRLLYQEEKLSRIPGEYTIRAQGRSCVMAQISLHYNVPPPPGSSGLNISVTHTDKCNGSRPQVLLFVPISYHGRREETNMLIINIKLLSGYVVDKSSLDSYRPSDSTRSNMSKVKRVDVEDGYVNFYLGGLKRNEARLYIITLVEDVPVRNLKPAVIKVYDYYQPSDEAVTEYTSSCAESDDVNQL